MKRLFLIFVLIVPLLLACSDSLAPSETLTDPSTDSLKISLKNILNGKWVTAVGIYKELPIDTILITADSNGFESYGIVFPCQILDTVQLDWDQYYYDGIYSYTCYFPKDSVYQNFIHFEIRHSIWAHLDYELDGMIRTPTQNPRKLPSYRYIKLRLYKPKTDQEVQ